MWNREPIFLGCSTFLRLKVAVIILWYAFQHAQRFAGLILVNMSTDAFFLSILPTQSFETAMVEREGERLS